VNKEDQSLITVSEARKIIGEGADKLSDEYLLELIYNLTSLARTYIKSVPK